MRDVERRIQTAERQSTRELPVVAQPMGIPETFDAHAKLMYDLLALAYQCDLTRVATFMIGKEVSGRSYPEIGVPDGHHACSHHQNDPVKLAKLAKINRYHVQHFTYFLEKLRNTPDGDGSLLDHSVFVYGSGSAAEHSSTGPADAGGGQRRQDAAGQAAPQIRETTRAQQLYVALLDKLGLPMDQFGDSTTSSTCRTSKGRRAGWKGGTGKAPAAIPSHLRASLRWQGRPLARHSSRVFASEGGKARHQRQNAGGGAPAPVKSRLAHFWRTRMTRLGSSRRSPSQRPSCA